MEECARSNHNGIQTPHPAPGREKTPSARTSDVKTCLFGQEVEIENDVSINLADDEYIVQGPEALVGRSVSLRLHPSGGKLAGDHREEILSCARLAPPHTMYVSRHKKQQREGC